MKREVVITPRAKIEIQNVFDYLESKWNEKIIRKAVISKQSSLYYHFDSKHIIVLSVFDNRQNPTKINKIK